MLVKHAVATSMASPSVTSAIATPVPASASLTGSLNLFARIHVAIHAIRQCEIQVRISVLVGCTEMQVIRRLETVLPTVHLNVVCAISLRGTRLVVLQMKC